MAASEKFNIIPIDGPRADVLLEHINVDRWDRGRPPELLRLVAYLSDYPSFAPIRPWHIRGLGRTDRQARYDHQVMVRMASDRILQRVPTTRGDLWRVNPDLRHWRGVPGIPSWRRVASLFSDPLNDICARRGPNSAGQRPYTAPVWSPEMEIDGVYVSATDLASRARNMARGGRPPGETVIEHGAPGPGMRAPIPFPSSTPSSYVHDDDGKRLVKAVEATIGATIFGAPADLLHRLAGQHRDRIDRLVELAEEILIGLRAPTRAAGVLAQAVEDGALDRPSPGSGLDPVAARRRSLEAQIRAWERAGAEPDDIDRLKSQLEDLGGA